MEADDLAIVKRNIILDCQDDWVGLWAIPWELRENCGVVDPIKRRVLTMRILADLLKLGLVCLGDMDFETGSFRPWSLSEEKAIRRVEHEWDLLGHEPDLLEIAWLAATPKGERWANELALEDSYQP